MSAQQALTGVNVLDFGWSIVGPLATKYFSDHGATVIKVESRKRIDIARTYVPMKDNRPGIDRCGWFDMYATGKYSISLNLGTARGLELAGKLVAWADVVLESFVAGQMAKWGLDYAGASRINPALVMISLSVFGQEGPMARQSGFGRQLQGYSGFTNLKGWPGLPPPGGDSYTDFIAPWYAIVALLAALDYRRRTGQGQYIDLSQHEAGINFLTPAVLDYSANGRVAAADGNRDAFNAPHGVYRCQGEDRWCAVAVEDDAAWRALCGAIGSPEMALEVKYATAAARKAS